MVEQPPPSPEQITVPTIWLPDTETPVLFANVFAVQPVQNEFILSFGTAVPPVITRPLTREEASKIQIEVKPSVRIGITADRALELIQLLQAQLRAYSQMTVKN